MVALTTYRYYPPTQTFFFWLITQSLFPNEPREGLQHICIGQIYLVCHDQVPVCHKQMVSMTVHYICWVIHDYWLPTSLQCGPWSECITASREPEWDLKPGPLQYKSTALTLSHTALTFKIWNWNDWSVLKHFSHKWYTSTVYLLCKLIPVQTYDECDDCGSFWMEYKFYNVHAVWFTCMLSYTGIDAVCKLPFQGLAL